MEDEDKTKSQLISELTKARQRVAEMEASTAEREQLEREIEERRLYLESVLACAPDAIVTLDVEHNIQEWNPGAEKLFGYTSAEVVGRNIDTLITSPDTDIFGGATSLTRQTLSGKSISPTETVRYRKDGSPVNVIVAGSPVLLGGKVAGVVAVYTDISERVRAERLLESLNQAALAMEQALTVEDIFTAIAEEFKKFGFSCMILPMDESRTRLTIEYINLDNRLVRAAEKLAGLKIETFSIDIEKVDVYREIIGEKKTVFIENVEDVMRQVLPGPAKRFAGALVRMTNFWEAIAAPLIVDDKVIGLFSVQSGDLIKDNMPAITAFAHQVAAVFRKAQLLEQAQHEIAERKQAEEALRASEEYVRSIIENSLDTIITVDVERRIVEFNDAAQETFGYRAEEILGKHIDALYLDPLEGVEVYRTTVEQGQCLREVSALRKNGEVFPSLISASALRNARGELMGVMGISRDISERKRTEESLRQRNRELNVLNRASQAFTSSLDLDQILDTVLSEVRRLLNVTACSVWLIEPETDDLVCFQVATPQDNIVRGWRLASGEGICGWVARHGESLVVPDAWADERYYRGVDEQTGLGLRSILTVPLRVKEDVIGVLQVLDTGVGRFSETDLELLEPLAASAAIAIENARLYEEVRQDAETRATLLREVNHRVKNNLTAIIGLLHAERRYVKMEERAVYQTIMQSLVGRVQGLATVHSMLSASEWTPLLLSELAVQIIHSSLHVLPRDKRVSVDVTPSLAHVTSDQAHNLALVINELTTNTVKHGLQEKGVARIGVRIKLDGSTVTLEFRDNGPGYPEEVLQLERSNVGFDLIQNIVRKSLHGKLSLHNDHGAVAVIQFEIKM
ncbi:MAG: hypothetical protein DRI81_09430 [Chloroflexi bacterium]|nr:MAG: hypothetical protein DRI81_09430 [Chloroflexota bacterium]